MSAEPDAELDAFVATLADVTEEECNQSGIDITILDDGRLPDDYGIEKVEAHNARIAKRRARNAKNKSAAINSVVTRVTTVTAANDEGCSGNPTKTERVTFSASEAIDPNETPPPKIENLELAQRIKVSVLHVMDLI